MYNVGSVFHTACLLLHFTPLLSAPAFSTPHFQSLYSYYMWKNANITVSQQRGPALHFFLFCSTCTNISMLL